MLHFLQSVWPYLIGALDILFAVVVTIHSVLRKPETSTAIAWVGLA
jgi:hypothetical protein